MGILIKNGHLVNPPTKTDEVMDLYVKEDRIEKIGKELTATAEDQVIDATGCYVFPGFIDLHVHLRDPGLTEKEDIEWMRKLAERDYVARIAQNTLAPNIRVEFSGPITKEADTDSVMSHVVEELREIIETAPEGVPT